jgi:hypothetical protein
MGSPTSRARAVGKKARLDVDQTWTKPDAEVIAFPEPEDENSDLPADSEGGRYWVRTSDPCVVSEGPRKLVTCENALFSQLRTTSGGVMTCPGVAWYCAGLRNKSGTRQARRSCERLSIRGLAKSLRCIQSIPPVASRRYRMVEDPQQAIASRGHREHPRTDLVSISSPCAVAAPAC